MEPENYAISGKLIADQEDPFGKKKLQEIGFLK